PGFDSFDPWIQEITTDQIVWRSQTYGTYSVDLNGNQIVKKGELVTLERVTDAMFTYAQNGFVIGIGLVAAFVLLLGLMKVGEDAGLVAVFARALSPLLRILFPDVPRDHPASGAIVMNITTSILGLGNASTPMGLKAIAELQKLNPRKDTATDAMCMLVGYNTSGFAIIATSMIATMKSAGTVSPLAIIGPTMAAGLASTIAAFIVVKILGASPLFKIVYTQEELDAVAEENRVTTATA
ncbi:MAG: nucleoside recognition domain-containing protein, partial [Candidatus Sumerlaeota bacterium]